MNNILVIGSGIVSVKSVKDEDFSKYMRYGHLKQ